MDKMLSQLKRERSLILDKEYPGSIGDLQDTLKDLKEQVEVVEKKITELRSVEKDLDAGIVAIARLMLYDGRY